MRPRSGASGSVPSRPRHDVKPVTPGRGAGVHSKKNLKWTSSHCQAALQALAGQLSRKFNIKLTGKLGGARPGAAAASGGAIGRSGIVATLEGKSPCITPFGLFPAGRVHHWPGPGPARAGFKFKLARGNPSCYWTRIKWSESRRDRARDRARTVTVTARVPPQEPGRRGPGLIRTRTISGTPGPLSWHIPGIYLPHQQIGVQLI